MKTDHLTYRRATSVSVLGMALQIVLGCVMLVFGYAVRDHTAISAAAFILCGVIVWVCLAVVYDQHRRERLEALEAETIRRTGTMGSSVFDSAGEDLKIAARRVAWMHRVMLPVVSLIFAAFMLGIGWVRVHSAIYGFQVLKMDSIPSKPG